MKLNLNKNLFNENYWELQNCKTRWVVNWGSAGSSKSGCATVILAEKFSPSKPRTPSHSDT